MIKTTKFLVLCGLLFSAGWMASCTEGGEGNSTQVSKNDGTRSHNNGRNCMDCHVKGGGGAGWFTAAGSTYKTDAQTSNKNGIIKIYDKPNGGGNMVASIEVDGLGNFYTTKGIDFGSGLYPSFESASGNTMYMAQTTITGACNSCHGISTPHINNN